MTVQPIQPKATLFLYEHRCQPFTMTYFTNDMKYGVTRESLTVEMLMAEFTGDVQEIIYIFEGEHIGDPDKNWRNCVRMRYVGNKYAVEDRAMKYLEISYGVKNYETEPTAWNVTAKQYTHGDDLRAACEIFAKRVQAKDPVVPVFHEKSGTVANVAAKRYQSLFPIGYENHIDYLRLVIQQFWFYVFQEPDAKVNIGWGEFINEHAKVDPSYRLAWAEHGIPFHRGMLLILLSRVGEILGVHGDRSDMCKWVIGNYPKYLLKILQAETRVLSDFGATGFEIVTVSRPWIDKDEWIMHRHNHGSTTAVFRTFKGYNFIEEVIQEWLDSTRVFRSQHEMSMMRLYGHM